jgi:hypothetical protein
MSERYVRRFVLHLCARSLGVVFAFLFSYLDYYGTYFIFTLYIRYFDNVTHGVIRCFGDEVPTPTQED